MTKGIAKQDVFIASVISIVICLYLAVFGSTDIEESTKISYSISLNSDTDGWLDSRRETGTYSNLGVPLYDSLQGTGGRLPYQASWAQSPEWPLRFVLDKSQYLLIRIFLSSLLVMLPALIASRSWRPHATMLQQFIVGMSLLSPVGLYLRWNEWSDTYSQTAAITGLVFLVLRRSNFTTGEDRIETIFQSGTDLILLFGCLAILFSGHPGVWPIAAFVLGPLVLAALSFSGPFRERLWRTMCIQKRTLMLILIPAVALTGITIWELVTESEGLAGWARDRAETTQGFYSDQALRGFTRGLLPDVLERTGSVLIASVFLPLVRLLFHYLPPSDFSSRMAGAFPRGEFAGLLAVAAGILSWRRIRPNTPEGKLLRVATVGQSASLFLALLVANDLLPLTTTPSGAWLIFPILVSLNVLVGCVLLGLSGRIPLLSVLLTGLNMFLTVVWVVMQLSFVEVSSGVQVTIPSRENRTELSSIEMAEIEPLLATQGRMLFLQSGESEQQSSWSDYVNIVGAGKPVVVPADPKIRNASQLVEHSPTSATITSFTWSTDDLMGLDRLLDFLEVEQVLVENDGPMAAAVADFAARVNQTASRRDSTEVLSFSGVEYVSWSRSKFSASVIPKNARVDHKRCPVLESDCPVLLRSVEAFLSPTPRLTVCENPCLWTFSTGPIAPGETLVVPVTYSEALVIAGSDSGGLYTLDVGGFLGVKSESGVQAGTYELTAHPDFRMYARVFVSYLYTGSFLLLILSLVRRREFGQPAAVAG